MEPPDFFRFLHVRGLWTATDEACVLDAHRRAMARGQLYATGVQFLVLCLALLRTAPFRGCSATQLRDLRYDGSPVAWPGRRRLVWHLCHELVAFEIGHLQVERAFSMRERDRLRREQALLEGGIAYLESELQRCQAGAPAPSGGYARNLAAFDRVRRLVTRVAAKAHKPPTVASLARSLVSTMQTLAPDNYRREAIYFAVAALLQDFGLTDRHTPRHTVANRVYQAVRPPRQRR